MKFNKWTVGLAAVGAVSLTSVARADEPLTFLQTKTSGTVISGYLDTSVEWRADSTENFGFSTSGFSFGIPFRMDKQNGFNFNVAEINISKAQDETPWATGFNISILAGPDAVEYNNPVNGGGGSGFTVKDANVVLRVPVGNGLDVKIGVFDTIIGYEVFESGSNPNFTRSYGYAIEPTQHTGVLFTYHVNDNISISAGIANTWSTGINTRDNSEGTHSYWNKTGMGAITLTAPQSWGWLAGSSMSAGVVYGFDQNVPNTSTANGGENRLNFYAGWTIPTPIKGFSVGGAIDYTFACYDGPDFDTFGTDYTSDNELEAYTLGLYATWQMTEKASLNVRGEYGHGSASSDMVNVGVGHEKFEGDVYAATATFQYNLWANVISRLEIRYDQVNGDSHYSSVPGSPGNEHSHDDQLSFYANFIYKF